MQYSVFVCYLTPKEKVMLNEMLLHSINQKEDRVMIVNLGSSNAIAERRVERLGAQEPLKEPSVTIV